MRAGQVAILLTASIALSPFPVLPGIFAAHLEKAERCDQRANDHRISAGRLLADAQKLCDEGGFAAFHERFCPNLGKTRTYELLAIATGKKSAEQIRADNAELVVFKPDSLSIA